MTIRSHAYTLLVPLLLLAGTASAPAPDSAGVRDRGFDDAAQAPPAGRGPGCVPPVTGGEKHEIPARPSKQPAHHQQQNPKVMGPSAETPLKKNYPQKKAGKP